MTGPRNQGAFANPVPRANYSVQLAIESRAMADLSNAKSDGLYRPAARRKGLKPSKAIR
jgi:hypothetical protein